MQSDRITLTPAQKIAEQINADETKPYGEAVNVEMVATAAAYVERNWGHYGYSLAISCVGFGWAMFRGHASDGSDFWFVVDRYCNVADVDAR